MACFRVVYCDPFICNKVLCEVASMKVKSGAKTFFPIGWLVLSILVSAETSWGAWTSTVRSYLFPHRDGVRGGLWESPYFDYYPVAMRPLPVQCVWRPHEDSELASQLRCKEGPPPVSMIPSWEPGFCLIVTGRRVLPPTSSRVGVGLEEAS